MAKSLKQVRGKLKLSRLESQTELLQHDLDVDGIQLIHPKHKPFKIGEAVIDGTINRTIEGASTVELTVNDRYGYIRRSGMLGSAVDINLDGLWFRLVKVSKQGVNLTLTFESREVAILRTYNKFRASAWNQITRTRFAQILVNEVREFKIPFVCPELHRNLKKERRDKANKAKQRDPGFLNWTGALKRMEEKGTPVKIKGQKPTTAQLNNIETVLDVGDSYVTQTDSLGRPLKYAPRKMLVIAIMVGIQESTCYNKSEGEGTSVGFFQEIDTWGSVKERTNLEHSAKRFYDKLARIIVKPERRNNTYNDLAQAVQLSGHPNAYGQWRVEAERIVTAYGLVGDNDKDTFDANNMGDLAVAAGVDKYQFMRGRPRSREDPDGEKEDSWTCLNRLAGEVHWRCFEVSGSVYFISEPRLFKSASRAFISEDSEGVDWIDFDYDPGKKNATVRITGRASKWEAPPGSVITIQDTGVVNGRWLVTDIRRKVFDTSVTITLKKPRSKLPEPKQQDVTGVWDYGQNQTKEYSPTPGRETDPPGKLPTGNALRKAVVNNPSIKFTRDTQRADIQFGLIKPALLRFMLNFVEAGHTITVSALKTDHSRYTDRGTESNHYKGLAVDMGNFTNQDMGKASEAQRWIKDNAFVLKIDELIGPDESLLVGGPYSRRTLDGHKDHIHVAVFP
jgi:hypothetical protein